MNILLAIDGMRESEPAISKIGDLALNNADRIVVLAVVDMALPSAFDIASEMLSDTGGVESLARQRAAEQTATAAKRVAALIEPVSATIETRIEFGSPARRIIETAEHIGADLIVLGSHGYNRWQRLLLGSVSDSVVHHASCAVLIAR